jgi:hypothetical protein
MMELPKSPELPKLEIEKAKTNSSPPINTDDTDSGKSKPLPRRHDSWEDTKEHRGKEKFARLTSQTTRSFPRTGPRLR